MRDHDHRDRGVVAWSVNVNQRNNIHRRRLRVGDVVAYLRKEIKMKKSKLKKHKPRIGVEMALAIRKHRVKESKKAYDRKKKFLLEDSIKNPLIGKFFICLRYH